MCYNNNMIMVFDIGNTHITMGFVKNGKVYHEMRYPSTDFMLGDFLKYIKERFSLKKITKEKISSCAISSVVPALSEPIKSFCKKEFKKEPFIVDSTKTILKVKKGSIADLGADRIADIEAALFLYPKQNLIILDFGTANTFCAVSKEGYYLGGAISAGLNLTMKALAQGAAQLGEIPLVIAKKAAGMTTQTQVQAGLYFTLLGSAKEITNRLKKEVFPKSKVLVVGTGGIANLYTKQGIFDVFEPNLTLLGIAYLAQKYKKG